MPSRTQNTRLLPAAAVTCAALCFAAGAYAQQTESSTDEARRNYARQPVDERDSASIRSDRDDDERTYNDRRPRLYELRAEAAERAGRLGQRLREDTDRLRARIYVDGDDGVMVVPRTMWRDEGLEVRSTDDAEITSEDLSNDSMEVTRITIRRPKAKPRSAAPEPEWRTAPPAPPAPAVLRYERSQPRGNWRDTPSASSVNRTRIRELRLTVEDKSLRIRMEGLGDEPTRLELTGPKGTYYTYTTSANLFEHTLDTRKMPKGEYTLTATRNGETLRSTVRID